MRLLILALVAAVVSGCATEPYRRADPGVFSGALDVRWVENDCFLFLPNKDRPFRFQRKNGEVIAPGPMFTDGGSIPKFLWGVDGFSPWGYAPAYIVHDWLFELHRCNYPTDKVYSFQDSVTLMGEALKTLMESNPGTRDYFAYDAITSAVGLPIARRIWEEGECHSPPARLNWLPDKGPPGKHILTIEFGGKP